MDKFSGIFSIRFHIPCILQPERWAYVETLYNIWILFLDWSLSRLQRFFYVEYYLFASKKVFLHRDEIDCNADEEE